MKFKIGDKVKIISPVLTKGKVGTVDYFNGSKYCVDFNNGWHGYYYPEELEHFNKTSNTIFQIEKELREELQKTQKKLDKILEILSS